MSGLPHHLHERLEAINFWLLKIQQEIIAIRMADPDHPSHMAIHGWGRRDDGSIGSLAEECRELTCMCGNGKAATPESPCPVCARTGPDKRRGD